MGARSDVGAQVRRVVASAVEPRFQGLDERLDRLEASLGGTAAGYPSTPVEEDLFALRQQMDEVLDLLRAQHARIRALEEALEQQTRRSTLIDVIGEGIIAVGPARRFDGRARSGATRSRPASWPARVR